MNSSTAKLSGVAKMLAVLIAGPFLMLPAAIASAPVSLEPRNGITDIRVIAAPQVNEFAQEKTSETRKPSPGYETVCSRLEWRVLREDHSRLHPNQGSTASGRSSAESGEVVSAVYRRGFAQPQLYPCAPFSDSKKQRLLVLLMLWRSVV
ncbi:MAG: hypothetical protein AB1710_09280 [Pseudomonadota bacterium]|jgi:hypothetical protein